ncbi:MAG: DUF937 domain-containing protein [Lewinellaceae bacterium]|nr:DUF937 domain-containing protein [Phaeodactylibacter sp.]MCB9346800.1 DUF937 domain-containing protein [Lewinellaceae bacterium]
MSSNLMDILQGSLSSGMVEQLSQQLGGADKQQTAAAASGIVTTLMGALAKNASSTEGAQALNNALERDHDGSILDDVMGMLTGNTQTNNSSMLNGAGILNHVLGNKQSGAIDMISKLSGLDSSKTGSLMTMLAPVIMGALGKTKQQQGLDVAGITSLLSGTVSAQKQQNPTMNLVTSFLDADGDGSIVDDVANMGMKILGGFFGRKK